MLKRGKGHKHSQGSSWAKPCSIFLGIILLSSMYAIFIVFVANQNPPGLHVSSPVSIPLRQSHSPQPIETISIVDTIEDRSHTGIQTTPVVKIIRPIKDNNLIDTEIKEGSRNSRDSYKSVWLEAYQQCPDIQRAKPQALLPFIKKPGAFDMHFIHVPKCGGTSMTAILREMACVMDPVRNNDCCTNPGFCDWHAMQRCSSIRGCINHIPQRPWIFKAPPSITILREPSSRILSAWFYRGHSPNLDFFQVRPYFKEISQGLRPRVTFDEYIEMPEYQNIQTRMFGADSFPYKNVTITNEIYCLAVEALENIFFIGLQEAYEISVELLMREMNITLHTTIKKERDQSNAQISRQKTALKNNVTLMNRYKELNKIDYDLYKLGKAKFCRTAQKYPDLVARIAATTSVKC